MSHYNPYSKTSLKKYEQTPTYLSKKRSERDSDNSSKKKYDYEPRYDKYDKHYHQSNSYIIKDYSNNYYRNSSSSKYRNRDNWCYQNKFYSKSPRRDYKKPYQKYSNDNEGVRNLSHCELPPSPKNKKEENNKNGLFQGINSFVSNIVSSHFPPPRQGTYQHTFQNQQNINIEINLTSPSQLIKGAEKRKRNYESRIAEREKEIDEFDEFKELPFSKPLPKLPKNEIIPFNKDSIKIEANPFDDVEILPKEKETEIPIVNEDTEKKETKIVDIQSGYLLAKIPNWRLVTAFVSADELKEEKFDKIIKEDAMELENKYYLVYDKNIERSVEKIIEQNSFQKNKLKNEIMNMMSGIEHCSSEVRKIQNKLFADEWKINYLDIKLEALDIKDNN